MKRMCDHASLNACFDQLVLTAANLGVALISEVKENASALASAAGLKPLELKRFTNAIGQAASQHISSLDPSSDQKPKSVLLPARLDDDTDPFGHGYSLG